MDPEKVTPAKFKVHTVIYNNGEFSVAYGRWENSDSRLAMRWNGDGQDIGYPNQGGNPLWFQLPNENIWTKEIMQAIDSISAYEQRLTTLNESLIK